MKTVAKLAVMIATVLTLVEWGAAEDPAPVARWSFEQAPGQSVADTVGHHTGVVKDALQQVAGVDGQALKFVGGLVSVPSAPTLQFTGARFSIAAWVNPYQLDAGQQMIVAKNVYSADQREWGLMLDSDNRFRFYLWQNGWKTLASPAKPWPGHWHHVAVTLSGNTGRLYVDGVQVGQNTAMTLKPSSLGSTTKNWIGRSQYSGDAYLNGQIDEFRIYSRALSAAEILALFQNP